MPHKDSDIRQGRCGEGSGGVVVRAWRRGVTAVELVVIAASVVVVGGVGVFVVPHAINAAVGDGASAALYEVRPTDPKRAAVHDALKEIFQGSRALVGVYEGGGSPFTEVMLWADDQLNPGEADTQELALVTHSIAMAAITVYTTGDGPRTTLSTGELLSPRLASRWRERSDVENHVVATGVSSLRIERVGGAGGASIVRVHLYWGGGLSDVNDAESVFEVRLVSASALGPDADE